MQANVNAAVSWFNSMVNYKEPIGLNEEQKLSTKLHLKKLAKFHVKKLYKIKIHKLHTTYLTKECDISQ